MADSQASLDDQRKLSEPPYAGHGEPLPPKWSDSIDAGRTHHTRREPPEQTPAERPRDDELVWVRERRQNMTMHDPAAMSIQMGTAQGFGELLLAGEARRAYAAQVCRTCWAPVVLP